MSRKDITSYLGSNPRTDEQVALIKDTQEALRGLREAGIVGEGYTLAQPFGARGVVPLPSSRKKVVRVRLKMTLDA